MKETQMCCEIIQSASQSPIYSFLEHFQFFQR